mgnify:CR=1 FL=1
MQLQNHLIFKPPFLLFCFLIYIGCAKAQVSIPPKPDGFWYHNRAPNPDSVVIEAFFDPLCPDSRDSWKPLKEAIQNYGSSIALVVHTFPLPYVQILFLLFFFLQHLSDLFPILPLEGCCIASGTIKRTVVIDFYLHVPLQ